MKNKTALITGASTGIGKELAIIHASKSGNLVIIARNESKLNKLKQELEKKYSSFIEEAYNVTQTDAGLSDFLYHEASKLKKKILNIKHNYFDAAF